MVRERIITYKIAKEYAGKRISAYLKAAGYPESALGKLRHSEGVLKINGVPVHINYRFFTDDSRLGIEASADSERELSVCIREEESSEKISPIDLSFEILYEDEDILVVNKPPFMPTHPSLNNYDNSLANGVAHYFCGKNEPFVFRCVNRLDRDTSGIVVLAKHYLAAGILAEGVRTREVKREYLAIAIKDEGAAELKTRGTISKPIARLKGSTIERTVSDDGETAITDYEILDSIDIEYKGTVRLLYLMKCSLRTGRTHQIRVHFKSEGYPLIGDFLYNPECDMMNRQALHSWHVSFKHPVTGREMDFKVPLYEDMRKFFDYT